MKIQQQVFCLHYTDTFFSELSTFRAEYATAMAATATAPTTLTFSRWWCLMETLLRRYSHTHLEKKFSLQDDWNLCIENSWTWQNRRAPGQALTKNEKKWGDEGWMVE